MVKGTENKKYLSTPASVCECASKRKRVPPAPVPLQNPFIAKAVISISRYYNMVYQPNIKHLTRLFQSLRYMLVVPTGLFVPARMIMHYDELRADTSTNIRMISLTSAAV